MCYFHKSKKAFNTVNHSIFLQKLEQYSIRGLPLQLLTSYYSDRTQYTIVNNHKLKASPVPCGVPQGSTLGLSLFTVYVNDLPQCSGFKTKLFVDDTVLTISNNWEAKQSFGVNREIREITKLNLRIKMNKLTMYYDKTKSIIFTPKKYFNNCKVNIECSHRLHKIETKLEPKHTRLLNRLLSSKHSGLANTNWPTVTEAG